MVKAGVPTILAVNKVDLVEPRKNCCPFCRRWRSASFVDVIPVSASRGDNADALMRRRCSIACPGEPVFPRDQITDRSERFFAAELLREQLIRRYHRELPYAITVEIERFEEEDGRYLIGAVIWVSAKDRGHPAGQGGQAMKETATAARKAMNDFFQTRAPGGLDQGQEELVERRSRAVPAWVIRIERLDPHSLRAAYVLHTRRYGDSSLLVDLLTTGAWSRCLRRQGRVAGKGHYSAHSDNCPFAGGARGRGEVLSLLRAEAAGQPVQLLGRALFCGLSSMNCLPSSPRQDASADLFDGYATAIAGLAGASASEPVLRRFEVGLLQHLGLGPNGIGCRGSTNRCSGQLQLRHRPGGPRRVSGDGPTVVTGERCWHCATVQINQ